MTYAEGKMPSLRAVNREAFRDGATFMYLEMKARMERLEGELWAARMEHFPNAEHDKALAAKRRQ